MIEIHINYKKDLQTSQDSVGLMFTKQHQPEASKRLKKFCMSAEWLLTLTIQPLNKRRNIVFNLDNLSAKPTSDLGIKLQQ